MFEIRPSLASKLESVWSELLKFKSPYDFVIVTLISGSWESWRHSFTASVISSFSLVSNLSFYARKNVETWKFRRLRGIIWWHFDQGDVICQLKGYRMNDWSMLLLSGLNWSAASWVTQSELSVNFQKLRSLIINSPFTAYVKAPVLVLFPVQITKDPVETFLTSPLSCRNSDPFGQRVCLSTSAHRQFQHF